MTTDIVIGEIRLRIDSLQGASGLLTVAYAPFLDTDSSMEPHGTLRLVDCPLIPPPDARIVATGFNDLGESRLSVTPDGAYVIGISPCPGEEMRYMSFAPGFREATLSLCHSDRWGRFILDSMLRILFSQIAVMESGFLIHASAVMTPAGTHMFMGCSGTGKSTHSSLWLSNFDDCALLNDDNPLVRLHPDGMVTAHGTPWSGKTPCWVNRSSLLLSMTRLRQSPDNLYTPLSGIDAFVSVLPGISVINHSRELYSKACDTLGSVVGNVNIGLLDCRPDVEAARLCRNRVESLNNPEI